MILGFSTKFPWGDPTDFPRKILDGTKIHTARIDQHNRWKPGEFINFAIGVRTKNYKEFALGRCIRVYRITINPELKSVEIDTGRGYKCEFLGADVIHFAQNDGFDSLEDFWRWFNKPFEGKLIYWNIFENGRSNL